ncbi:MAG TPA: MBL fold metallo-hydrolase [Longimicrobiales bacterium]|nr:MBL fold metallo-hydrolase [Longimicrobiales bacterium]
MSESRPPSRRDDKGRFTHPWRIESGASRGFRDIMRWQLQRIREGVPPDPPASAFDIAEPQVALPRCAPDEVRITWVGHATFLLQLAGVNILTDPVWSRRASPIAWAGPSRIVPAALAFDALPPIDVVAVSHDHYDHLDARTISRLAERFAGAQWVAPLGHADWLRRRGAHNVTELDWWQRATFETQGGTLDVDATPAQHWTKRTPWTERTRLWSSFVFHTRGRRIFFCGDSGYFDGFGAIGAEHAPFDAVLMPIGAYEPRWFMRAAHMNPEEAVQSYLDLGGTGTFVGMHWGTFRLTDEPAMEPPERARAAWLDHGLPADRLFLARHGETRILRRP